MRKLYLYSFLLCLISIILAFGPYLPHPKRWVAFVNKPEITYGTPDKLNTISIIIPSYNDGRDMLYATIASVVSAATHPELLQLIVVDGGSSDDTMRAAEDFTNIITTKSAGGRGPAINAGIAKATGDLLLFLHSDCLVEPGFDMHLQQAFANSQVIMAAFEFNANSAQYPHLAALEQQVNQRSRKFWMPYGDQALAIRTSDLREHFGNQIPNYKMMEDLEFVLMVRNFSLDNNRVIAILPQKVVSSPRRFLAKGVSTTAALNWFFVTSYVWGGRTPDQIYAWYY